MGAFRKFVEWGTSCSYVPLGRRCDICGKRLGFFQTGFWSIRAKQLSDGVLCSGCDEKLELLLTHRALWIPRALRKESPYCDFTPRNKFLMPVHTAKRFLSDSEETAKACLSAFGSDYTSVFRMTDACFVAPTALQVGLRRSEMLRGKLVLFGFVQLGRFRQGDPVLILDGSHRRTADVLEAYAFDCPENTLDVMLKAHMGPQRLDRWQTGWLVLDSKEPVGHRISVIGTAPSEN